MLCCEIHFHILPSFCPIIMQINRITEKWGYKLLPGNRISFYHVLLSSIPQHIIANTVDGISHIERQNDDSIIIHVEPFVNTYETLKSLLSLCNKRSSDFLETPTFYYKIPHILNQSLPSWALAFEGCLALLLITDPKLRKYFRGNWEYINAPTGGLFLPPYTILLYKEYPKIVHPVTSHNFSIRKMVEQKTAHNIRNMLKRMEEAQQGLEGMALLSMVEEKTRLSTPWITKHLNEKSFQIKARIYSPFFSEL